MEQKIEGFVGGEHLETLDERAIGTVFCKYDIFRNPVPATLVLGPAYTANEVKEMLKEIAAGIPKEYDERVDIVAQRFGITL